MKRVGHVGSREVLLAFLLTVDLPRPLSVLVRHMVTSSHVTLIFFDSESECMEDRHF